MALMRAPVLALVIALFATIAGTAAGESLSARANFERNALARRMMVATSTGSKATDRTALLSFKANILRNKNTAAVIALFGRWTGPDPCLWGQGDQYPAVRCDANGRVSVVAIYNTPLNGTLNAQFTTLNRLTSVALAFSGNPFPAQLLQMTNLVSLFLAGFSGPVPESISNLKNLASLGLEASGTSRLPQSIGTLSKLQELWVGGNFTGELPGGIMRLTALRTLSIQDTRMYGVLSASFLAFIGRLPNYLSLRVNYFAGNAGRSSQFNINCFNVTACNRLVASQRSLSDCAKFYPALKQPCSPPRKASPPPPRIIVLP